jgi:hypothetical protein
MPLDGFPTIDEIRRRVISELVDSDVRFAARRRPSRKQRFARSLRRGVRKLIA